MYHCDHRGLPLALVNEDNTVAWRAEYDEWGNQLSEENPQGLEQLIRLPGQQYDEESGLYYNRNRNRYYEPERGRYITQDPIGLKGGWNSYQYPLNPIVNIDPLGLVDINFVPDGQPLHEIVENINIPNTFTVGVHGNPYYIITESGAPLSPDLLAVMIKMDENYKEGEPVKLIACNTANGGSGSFASLLAKALNARFTGAEGYYAGWWKKNKDGTVNLDSVLMVPVNTQNIGRYGDPVNPSIIGNWVTFGPDGKPISTIKGKVEKISEINK
ncbi:RHS repeat protein [Salmonella enterica subsp. enterica]|nr:RHS repeat protein [Salmonella enterica subsp. enterica]